MKFNGPAPELINARLAMVGFLYAASNEVHAPSLADGEHACGWS